MDTYIGPDLDLPTDTTDVERNRPARLAIAAVALSAVVALFGYSTAGSNHDTPVPVSSQPAGEGGATFSGNIPYDSTLAP